MKFEDSWKYVELIVFPDWKFIFIQNILWRDIDSQLKARLECQLKFYTVVRTWENNSITY